MANETSRTNPFIEAAGTPPDMAVPNPSPLAVMVAENEHNYRTNGRPYGEIEMQDNEARVRQVLDGGMTMKAYEEARHKDVAQMREEITWLGEIPEYDSKIDTYFESDAPVPPMLRDAKQAAGADQTWTKWLAEKATDAQIMNFVEWQNHNHNKRKYAPELTEKYKGLQQEYLNGVARLKELGLLHDEANVTMQDFEGVDITLEDIFVSYLLGDEGRTGENGRIRLIENHNKHIVDHEFTHLVLGRFGELPKDPKEEWINEALVDHLALVANGQDPDVLDPRNQLNNDGKYIPERIVLAGYLEFMQKHGGADPLTLRDLTRYVSARSKAARAQARTLIDRKNDEVFGDTDIIREIGTCLADLMEREDITTEDEYRQAASELAANIGMARMANAAE